VAILFQLGQAQSSKLVKSRSTATARLPEFVEPMKAKLVNSMPSGDWIEEREAKLEELLKKPPSVIRYPVSFTKDIPELLERAGRVGLECLIGKRAGSRL
jgi:hypothetical protein